LRTLPPLRVPTWYTPNPFAIKPLFVREHAAIAAASILKPWARLAFKKQLDHETGLRRFLPSCGSEADSFQRRDPTPLGGGAGARRLSARAVVLP